MSATKAPPSAQDLIEELVSYINSNLVPFSTSWSLAYELKACGPTWKVSTTDGTSFNDTWPNVSASQKSRIDSLLDLAQRTYFATEKRYFHIANLVYDPVTGYEFNVSKTCAPSFSSIAHHHLNVQQLIYQRAEPTRYLGARILHTKTRAPSVPKIPIQSPSSATAWLMSTRIPLCN